MWTYSAQTNQYGAIINARGFEAEVPGNACNVSIHSALQALLEEAQRQKQIFLNFVRDEGADDALIKASHSAFKVKIASKQLHFYMPDRVLEANMIRLNPLVYQFPISFVGPDACTLHVAVGLGRS